MLAVFVARRNEKRNREPVEVVTAYCVDSLFLIPLSLQ